MNNQIGEPSLHGLLNQFEDIGGPETYGPAGIAILIALWRKSCKLGWKETFLMTNTELQVQTGIKSRDTINSIRSRIEADGLIRYKPPPKGQSRGEYWINFQFNCNNEPVQNLDNSPDNSMDNPSNPVHEPVRILDNLADNYIIPVQNLDNSPDTVLKDTITTTSIDPRTELLETYCEMNKRLSIHVKPAEREAMGKMVAGGMPNPFTIRTMELLLQEKRKREGQAFKYPTSFLYYENGIWEAWNNLKYSPTDPKSNTSGGSNLKPKSKHDQQLSALEQLAREEQSRG